MFEIDFKFKVVILTENTVLVRNFMVNENLIEENQPVISVESTVI